MSGAVPAPALEVAGVTKRFPGGAQAVTALDDVSFEVAAGESVALLGPNGAGKTTLLDLVCGLVEPTHGRLLVAGASPRRAVTEGRLAGVLQTGGLLRDLTVRETVQVVAALHRLPGRVDAVLAEAGLSALAGRRVGRCSGGEQQRLKYALALVPDPQLLVLDEPTVGLDQEGREELWQHVRRGAERGMTVLYSTHHLDEIGGLADRVVLLDHGRISGGATVAELTGGAADRLVRASVPDAAALATALDALTGADGVRDEGSAGRLVSLRVAAHRSDEVVRRLLNEFGAAGLRVGPPRLEDALAALMRAGG